jgi:hypothetical protein
MKKFKESSNEDFSSEPIIDTPIKYWITVGGWRNQVTCGVGSEQLFGEDNTNQVSVEYENGAYKESIRGGGGEKLSYEEASDLNKVISICGWNGALDDKELELLLNHPDFKTACKTWKKFIDKLKNGGDKVESSIISKISQALKD